ncbi:MAG: ribonuclease HII [Pseudomonadota bacterium]
MDSIKFDQQFNQPVCGIDEVGRGPLAGPVVAACVFIKPESQNEVFWAEITDSKKISAKKREILFDKIITHSLYGIAELSSLEVDRLNIHQATLEAMKLAYEMVADQLPDDVMALVDGKFPPKLRCKTQTVIKGDSLSTSIGAASILAKVHRDRLMHQFHEEYPYYAWNSNAGYGTKAHMEGLQKYGLSPYHRLSFAPCSKIAENMKKLP